MGNSKTIWRTGKKWLINKGRKALACFGGGNVEEEDIPDLRSWPTINLVVEQELQCPQDRIDYELDNIAKVDESCEHVEVTNEEFIILPEQNQELGSEIESVVDIVSQSNDDPVKVDIVAPVPVSLEVDNTQHPGLLQKFIEEARDVFGASDQQAITLIMFDRKQDMQTIVADDIPANISVYFDDMVDPIEKIAVFRHIPESAAGWESRRIYHAFVVLNTKDRFYSIERDLEGITIRRSTDYNDVACPEEESSGKDGYEQQETQWAQGNGTVGDLILFVKEEVLIERYNMFLRNCQHFSAKVFKHFNNEGKTFKKYRKSQR